MISYIIQNYPGEMPRPWPQIAEIEKNNTLAFFTPWSKKEAAEVGIAALTDYYLASSADPEATSPFSKLAHLSKYGNQVRTGAHITNQAIFQKINKDSLSGGSEFLLLSVHGNELNWVQVGQPNLLLYRQGQIFPLSLAYDLDFQYQTNNPLPCELLGIEKQPEYGVKSFLLKPADKLIVASRSSIPRSFTAANFGALDSNGLSQALLNLSFDDSQKLACWLAVIDLSIGSKFTY